MKILFTLLLMLIATPANAEGWYATAGIAVHSNHDTIGYEGKGVEFNTDKPLGVVDFGYNHKGLLIGIEHISSIPNKRDRGINLLFLKVTLF